MKLFKEICNFFQINSVPTFKSIEYLGNPFKITLKTYFVFFIDDNKPEETHPREVMIVLALTALLGISVFMICVFLTCKYIVKKPCLSSYTYSTFYNDKANSYGSTWNEHVDFQRQLYCNFQTCSNHICTPADWEWL